MKTFSFLFQIVAVTMPLKESPGYPEKFKILNPFEEIFVEWMDDTGGPTVSTIRESLQTLIISDPRGFVFKLGASGT
jgi:hypothetical protein